MHFSDQLKRPEADWRRRFKSRGAVELVEVTFSGLHLRCPKCQHEWVVRPKKGRPPRAFDACPKCRSDPGPRTTITATAATVRLAKDLAASVARTTGRRCTIDDAVALALGEALARRGDLSGSPTPTA